MPSLSALNEQQMLVLAIAGEEADGQAYADFAEFLQEHYPHTSQIFAEMAKEEHEHRRALIDAYTRQFGSKMVVIDSKNIRGLPKRLPPVVVRQRGIRAMRQYAVHMERAAARLYGAAAARSTDTATRRLLGDLAEVERHHEQRAQEIEKRVLREEERRAEDKAAHQRFLLQVIQPGLVGLIDGSVSTLAPVFAAAFAFHHSWPAFLVGMAASLGAGISMGFAEALSDDGRLTGRGHPILRGLVCGVMTMLGGIGHTLPFLIPSFYWAVCIAVGVAACELGVICWVRHRFQETSWALAGLQIVLGGGLVVAAGVVIGGLV